MKTKEDIIALSDSKLAASEHLLNGGFVDDSYYLAGYSFELLLKAKICMTLAIPDLFDFDNPSKRTLSASRDMYKQFKVHDYEQLLILSGLYSEFSSKISTDSQFVKDWSIISLWNESLRYCTGCSDTDAAQFIKSIKNMMSWLRLYL